MTDKLKHPSVVIRPSSWASFLMMAQRASLSLAYSHEEGAHALLFRGTEKFEEALVLGRDGYLKGAEKAAEIGDPLASEIQRRIVKTELQFSEEGTCVDIERYLSGDPEHWYQWVAGNRIDSVVDTEDPHRQRLLRMVVNVSPSSEVTPDTIYQRGVVVAALAELFEFAGHRVEINAVLASEYEGKRVELWVPVKLMTEPLQKPRLAFALAHRAFVRRLGFAVLESATLPDDRCERGYGHAADVIPQPEDLYFPKLDGNKLGQVEATTGWLLTSLRDQGVRIREEVVA
jgi:hypothetical protein